MNCRRIEELIPLYVEGDLDSNRAELVSAHLKSCDECSRVASGFDESQQWLRSYAPPAFDSTFFNGLKNGVLARIEEERARRSFFQLAVARWRWNAALTAAALLVLIGGLVFYAYQRNPRSADRQIAVVDPPRPDVDAPRQAPGPNNEESRRVGFSRQRRHHSLREAVAKAVEPVRLELMLGIQDPRIEYPSDSILEDSGVSQDSDYQVETQSLIKVTYPMSESMTRIEIQTGDPTIRIIWFAPNIGDKNSSKRSTDS